MDKVHLLALPLKRFKVQLVAPSALEIHQHEIETNTETFNC